MNALRRARHWAYTQLHEMSLTARLVAVVVVLALVAFTTTTALTAMLLRDYLTEQTDQKLSDSVTPLNALAWTTLDELRRGRLVEVSRYFPSGGYYVVITERATQSAYALGFSPDDPTVPDLAVPWGDERLDGEPFTIRSQDGTVAWRAVARSTSRGEGTVAVALPMDDIEDTVNQVIRLSLVIGTATLVAVALLAWAAVRRAFRPLARIEDTAAAIAAGDLTRRIPERNASDEVASLSTSLNQMLTQIEQSFAVREASEQRMRQFVADASHELRTPLATVRGYAELYRVGGIRGDEDVAGAMRRIESEATRMARLVEDMLLLTRFDTEPSFERRPTDLTVLAADTVQDARARAPQRDIRLVPLGRETGPAPALGDEHALRQVLANLVTNALSHTPADTPVEVATGVEGDRVVLEVRDHGPGIPPAVAERVFERFYRADPSRSRAQGGTGLGLAIVAAIVSAHHGRVTHRPTPGGGATFRVELPRADVSAPARTGRG
ncbi:MAG TPA: HAMP domain-containing sensor histidine kinase [Ornithinicoccus sp.]|nr:HAMP domain-containing sensor histidine kinase [Ornithinicoccus sp.]